MEERLMARLFFIQRKLKAITAFDNENAYALVKISIEFEFLLTSLLSLSSPDFCTIANDYLLNTQRDCELGCEFVDDNNRKQAFDKGVFNMNLYLAECIGILLSRRKKIKKTGINTTAN